MPKIWAWWACTLSLAVSLAQAQPRFEFADTPTRLPKTVLPSRVHLRLAVDPASDGFEGESLMQLRAVQAVPAIVLHAYELQADAAELRHAGRRARPLAVQPDPATQTWRLVPRDGRPITAGAWQLWIRYRGQVQRTGEGLYRADYRVGDQAARLLGTQLEAVNARRLLPVFDEPVFRCVFELEVQAPAGWQVYSNMPETASRPAGAGVRHRFAPTPPMPSYLLAVSVGRFDTLQDRSGAVSLRIFTAPGKREQARLAMEVTRQVLPFYGAYFGRPYALPKLDQVAVPTTRSGAMEDWGLISYIENALLFDPERSDASTRQWVFGVAAHEISHQWFGDLVSVASWNEIWLNEAFATWMANKATAHFHPEWLTDLRHRQDIDRTMARDATAATRAIRSGPVDEGSLFDVFDDVTYLKGGAVLSMLEQWIGAAAFQRGLASYMADRAFKPATAGDLWQHIDRAAGLPPGQVGAVAATWTDQPGLPVVEVSERCEADQTWVTLRQSRFSQGDPLAGGPWAIPLNVTRDGATRALLLQAPEQTMAWPGCPPTPLVVGAGEGAYFRVDYAPALRQRLVADLAGLKPVDRVALVSDSHALAEAGRYAMAAHVALLRDLPQVNDDSRPALFAMALGQWQAMETTFADTPAAAPLARAGIALFAPELARLGWQPAPGENSETQALRSDLVFRLAKLGHAPTLAEAHARFTAALAHGPTVPTSLRLAVLYAAGSDASDAEFDALLAALLATQSQEERHVLLDALTAGTDPARARRLLDESLGGRLPNDMAARVPGAVASVPALVPLCYDFVLAHWDALVKIAGEGSFGTRHWLLPGTARNSADPATARRLVVDQQRLDGSAGQAPAAEIAARIDSRARLRDREASALATALGQ